MLTGNLVALPEGASLMDALGGVNLPWWDIKVSVLQIHLILLVRFLFST